MKALLLLAAVTFIQSGSHRLANRPDPKNILVLQVCASNGKPASFKDNAGGIWVKVFEHGGCSTWWTMPKTLTQAVIVNTSQGNFVAVQLSEFSGIQLLSYPSIPIPKELQ